MVNVPKVFDSKRWIKFVIDHPVPIFALTFLLTLFSALQLPKLQIQTAIYDLAIENLPETIAYHDFKRTFGTEEIVLVVAKSRNIFEKESFQRLDQLSRRFSEIKGVKKVISLPFIKKDIDLTKKWGLADFEKLIRPIELFDKNLISSDKRTTAISLILEDVPKKDAIIGAVEKIIGEGNKPLSLYQIGLPVVSRALAAFTQKDFLRLPPITFLVIGLVLIVTFRRLYAVLLPVGCVLVALVWTFGLMSWSGTPLSMVTMIVPVFLIAVGTAYCLHILSEHRRSAQESDSSKEATFQTYVRTGLPSVLAVLTTIIGLGSLLANRISAIREFAYFSCFGMVSILILILCLLPALLSLLPLPKRQPTPQVEREGLLAQFLEKIIQLNLERQRMCLIVISIVVFVAALGIFRLRVETNPIENFKKSTSISQQFHDIYRDMAGSFPMNVVVDGKVPDYFENPAHILKLRELQGFLDSLEGVDKTISFADYLQVVNYATNKYQPEYYALPQKAYKLRMLMNSFKSLLGHDMFGRFMNEDLSKTNILLRTHISSSSAFLATKKKILEHGQGDSFRDVMVQVTGLGIVIAQSSHLLAVGQIKSLSVTLGLIFAVIFLLFVSVRVGLIAMIPNVFPILMNFGLMGWLGIRLSISTSLIACIAIGLAVDDTIHYLFRYNLEFKKDPDRNSALRATIRSVGRPIVITTITIATGFFILTFSSFKPTAEFGLLMVVTMFSALVGDLLFLPSLMLRLELVTIGDLLKSISSLDRMSDGIAHELNQPLNAIKMGSEFLKMMIQKGEKIPEQHLSEVLNEMSQQVDRAAQIISHLRALGQKVDLNPEKIDLNKAIRDVLAVMANQITLQNIDIKLQLDETISPIMAHEHRLKQAIFNLLTNAWEAMNDKQKARPGSDPDTLSIRTSMEEDKVVLTVSDTGIGMSRHEKERIFEPFFTTKESGRGRGLGLAMTIGIVKDSGGKIQIHTEKWAGTTVKVLFPKPYFQESKEGE